MEFLGFGQFVQAQTVKKAIKDLAARHEDDRDNLVPIIQHRTVKAEFGERSCARDRSFRCS